MALTTRWDRDVLAPEKIRLLRQLADSRGLEIQVYSQVRRDRGHMEKLAHLLHPGREPILFGIETHAEWEAAVRALHRECAVVVSDRLHALIVGATEGAIPLGMSNQTTEKVVRTLEPAGFAIPLEAADAMNRYLDECLADDDWVVRRVDAARTTLDDVRAGLRAVVDGGRCH
jgi:polysaccharide pyruvyl transferase WcaK-like protein